MTWTKLLQHEKDCSWGNFSLDHTVKHKHLLSEHMLMKIGHLGVVWVIVIARSFINCAVIGLWVHRLTTWCSSFGTDVTCIKISTFDSNNYGRAISVGNTQYIICVESDRVLESLAIKNMNSAYYVRENLEKWYDLFTYFSRRCCSEPDSQDLGLGSELSQLNRVQLQVKEIAAYLRDFLEKARGSILLTTLDYHRNLVHTK